MTRNIVQVDLSDFDNHKQAILEQLWKAACDIGFFYVHDELLSQKEVDEVFTLAERFFALPVEEKSKYVFSLDKNIGWESGKQKRQSFNLPELKESLQIKWHGMDEDNKWPTEVINFRTKMEAFMAKCQTISDKILECFAVGLGFNKDFFKQNHDITRPDCQQTFRLMHYFSVAGMQLPDVPGGFWRAGSHTDFETITLLFQKGQGLEVCPGREAVTQHAMGDEWTPVPALPGCITVNLGDALMRWSGDALKSNYHRVRMPLPGEHQGSRYSIAYFNQANKSAVISDPTGKYEDVSAEQFVRDSLRAIYVN